MKDLSWWSSPTELAAITRRRRRPDLDVGYSPGTLITTEAGVQIVTEAGANIVTDD